MRMHSGGKRVQRDGRHLFLRGLLCLLAALLAVGMVLVFVRWPQFAPPGVLRYLFPVVPLALAGVLLWGIYRSLRGERRGAAPEEDGES